MVRGRLTWPGVSVRAAGGASIVRVTVRWVNKDYLHHTSEGSGVT